MTLIHAFELLAQPPGHVPDVVAVFGNDATLRCWVLQRLWADGDVTQWEGDSAEWSDLRDDLATASLFEMEGKRTIAVRGADSFISKHRGDAEKYLARPGAASRLIFELESLPSNTRLYKTLRDKYLLVACGSSTDAKAGVTAASRRKFLSGYVAARHGATLSNAAADTLVELMGDDIGMLDTEIARLALYLPPGGKIDEELVREIVTTWQGKTIWKISDSIAAGNAAEALRQLDRLMSGGQDLMALFPQMAWSLRRLGMATAIVEHCERCGRRWNLNEVIKSVGVHRAPDVQQIQKQLKGMGRERARELLPWLLDADLRLKGTHSGAGRNRFLLEQLVMKLAKSDV